ncbi:hypothetical protein AYK20_02330 [Thermoplasmatales archaeon SG8-52-1]|nr:MAG: hypothetical protein AYK20_02330 [Thermoplasmatales archaeon SG8-52-1]
MRKILPFLVIGILVLAGLGAGALQIDNEKLELKKIESITPAKEERDFTHTVLAEFGTTSSCPHCPPVSGYLYDIQGSGEYDFYFITLNADKETLANARYWEIPGASGSVPQVFFDGGYSTLIGNQGSKTPYISKIVQAGARTVPDIDLNVAVDWLGDAEIEVTVGVTNNEGSSYSGHLHAYITEIVSRWYDNSGNKYHYSMIGYAFNQNINVGAGNTWSDTVIWDGDSHPPYGNIQEDNIMVIVSIFNPSNKYLDETAAATPGGGGTNNPPETPDIDGTTNGNAGTKYTYTFNSVDPDGDDVYYYIKWDDGHTEVWDGPHASGTNVNIDHTYTKEGTFTIEAKAKDIYGEESAWGTLTVTMPRTKSISNTFLVNILKQISQVFPIFNKILNL